MEKWKPVVTDSFKFSNKFDDLIGIEEIEVYDDKSFIKNVKEDKQLRKRKKKCLEKSPRKKVRNVKKNLHKSVVPKIEDLSFLDQMKSWGSFGIHNEILFALYEKKFFEPTKIQSRCLGPAIHGHLDILGAAETGSGKTLAFGIPVINGIYSIKSKHNDESSCEEEQSDIDEKDWDDPKIDMGCVKVKNLKVPKEKSKLFALILTPTRELAVQVKSHLQAISKYTDINIALVVGGLSQEKQERILKKRPEIVVGTPGRLWELINEKNFHLQDISNIRFLVIDETDRMLEKGHFMELSQLLERINLSENKKKKRQNFVFSATLTIVHDPPAYLKGKKKKRITPGQKLQDLINRIGITNPKVIDITNSQVTAENLIEHKILCKFEEKDYYLYLFLKTHEGRTIVFCNSIGCVKRLANLLAIVKFKPLPLHANMEQKQRLKNLEKFCENNNSLLLATDVAARGLDIPNVDHVIHYQVPKTAETYVHRSGRTARIDKTGDTLLLIEPQEHKTYIRLIHTLGRDREIENLDVSQETINHIKKIINLARDVDQLCLAIKKENSKFSWYQKAIKDLDIVVDEEELPKRRSSDVDKKIKKDLNYKKKQLQDLLNKPIFPKSFSGKFPDTYFKTYSTFSNMRRDKLRIPGAFVLKNVADL